MTSVYMWLYSDWFYLTGCVVHVSEWVSVNRPVYHHPGISFLSVLTLLSQRGQFIHSRGPRLSASFNNRPPDSHIHT